MILCILVASCKITLCLIDLTVAAASVLEMYSGSYIERPTLLYLLILDSHYALSGTTGVYLKLFLY